MSGPFSSMIQLSDREARLEFSGSLNESAVLPRVPDKPIIRISLRNCLALNSIGTRLWSVWLRQLPATSSILLEDCPLIFVKAFNQVQGFLTSNTRVDSFIVPFYSERTGESADVQFKRGKHFTNAGPLINAVPVVIDSQGNRMEMDIVAESYFSFLTKVS
jgi:hypothetical protein